MSLASVISACVGLVEVALAVLSPTAAAYGVYSYRVGHDAEATVLVGLAVIGAFCLVALDAARRGAGL